jgi:phosphoribosylformimino-5-aminoimidazole carboxamide ribotide isomerase
MIVYPAIDLKDGLCVRLLQGREDEVTVFSRDPALMAQKWQKEGAQMLHVIDLDGAFKGRPQNTEALRKIIQAVDIPIEFGGGVREIDILTELFEMGVAQVVLGTTVITNPSFVARAVELYGSRVLVGIDARGGKVAIQGWREVTDIDALEVAKEVEGMGISRVVYTDIERDGALVGPNIEGIRALAGAIRIPVIASGGVSTLENIKALKALEPLGVEGIVIGKALYVKAFTLRQAIGVASGVD